MSAEIFATTLEAAALAATVRLAKQRAITTFATTVHANLMFANIFSTAFDAETLQVSTRADLRTAAICTQPLDLFARTNRLSTAVDTNMLWLLMRHT